jgi:hypothetical protein
MPANRRRKELAAEERRIFTQHVRALATGEETAGHLQEFWDALRVALRSELKRRGLWDAPPSYLGIHIGEKWETGGGRFGPEAPLEDLLAECYAYVFVARLPALSAQLKVKPNVDGLVFLNIRHFLHERQREHDPIGSLVFVVLRSAVRLAVEEGELRVLQGDERIRNDTVLSFGMATEVGEPEGRLAAIAVGWNDKLLPDLLTRRGHRQEEVVRRLRELLRELSEEGIEVFHFRDLVQPLKADAQARWSALLAAEQGETLRSARGGGGGEVVRFVHPSEEKEHREAQSRAKQIDDLYGELLPLMSRAVKEPSLQKEVDAKLLLLRQLQEAEADEMEKRFEAGLLMKPGEGKRALERARELLAQYEDPSIKDSAPQPKH